MVPEFPGNLATYGQIADLIGAYGCARQVGWALRRLKPPSTVLAPRGERARSDLDEPQPWGATGFSGSC